MSQIKVLVSGARGRMGSEVIRAVMSEPALELVAAVDPRGEGQDSGNVAGLGQNGVIIHARLEDALAAALPDVAIDFTEPGSALANALAMVQAGARPVIGTTGISPEGLDSLRQAIDRKGISGLVAPNFAIGAVLMMKFATAASRYLPDCEIIELHHDQKKDAPSGTALYTAQMIAASRGEQSGHARVEEQILVAGARGGASHGIPIHSVRLAGFVASQEVIFGGPGQTLTIRHDTVDRKCFMPGVILAARRIPSLSGFFLGLESILED